MTQTLCLWRAQSDIMRMQSAVIALMVSVGSGVLAEPTFSQGRGQGQGQAQGQSQGQSKANGDARTPQAAAVAPFIFNDHDRDLVLRHYTQTAGLPPGLAKKDGDLPPGLAKQLRRNGTLPPGLQEKLRPFPRPPLDQLRPPPAGHRLGIADNHVMIYRPDTYLIVDILLHVGR